MVKQRCRHTVIDKCTGNKRLCKHNTNNMSQYCNTHYNLYQNNKDYATYCVCCFCGEQCNPCSQSCGICARIASAICIGQYMY